MADRIILPRATDDNGDIVAAAKATFFQKGTTTPLTVYSDEAATTPVAVPLEADAEGVFIPVYTTSSVKVIVTDTEDVNLPGYPSDPHYVSPASATGASSVTFSPITGNAANNVQTAIANLTALWNAVTTYGKSLIAAADAAAARGVLGLGSSATVDMPDDNDLSNDGGLVARRSNVYAALPRVLLEETAISSAVDYTTPDISGYKTVVIEFDNIKPSVDDGDLRCRTSPDGSSFDSAATAYAYALTNARGGSSITQDADTGASFIFVTGGVGNAAGDSGASGRIIVHNADAALPTQMEINSVFENTNNDIRAQNGGAHRKASAAVLKLQLYFNNGDTLSGNYRVYGVK